MATGRVPTTANSPLTAKGDLFGYSTTQARVPVGNDGETLVADSSTSTGLRWQGNYTAGKNKLINGAMAIAQRGTSATISSNGYCTVDRFVAIASSSQTWSQDTAQVPTGFRYALKMLANTSISAGGMQFQQVIESNNAYELAGQNVTLSLYAYASTSTAIALGVQYNTTADAAYNAAGWTSATNVSGGSGTANTTWSRISGVWSIPSTAKTVLIQVYNNATVTNTNFISFTGVQLELGNVATAFQTATGTLAGELDACMRYYQVVTRDNYAYVGQAFTTSQAAAPIIFLKPMRVSPSITLAAAGSGTGQMSFLTSAAAIPGTIGTFSATNITFNGFRLDSSGFTGAFTAGNATFLWTASAGTEVWKASAEL